MYSLDPLLSFEWKQCEHFALLLFIFIILFALLLFIFIILCALCLKFDSSLVL